MNEGTLRHARLNGTEIAYAEVGAGAPCLVMHGGLGVDHTQFREWLDPLGDALRLAYYDHRGNGRSARPPTETIALRQLVDDAEQLRIELGFSEVVVFGHSLGGSIAIDYALAYPQRVSHLILVGTTAAWDHLEEFMASFTRLGPSSEVIEALFSEPETDAQLAERERRLAPLAFYRGGDRFSERIFRDTRWSVSAWRRGREIMTGYDRVARLREIRCPTLILSGRHDLYGAPSQAERLARGIEDSELVIFSDSGHYPFAEEPIAFRRAVRRFVLRRQRSRCRPFAPALEAF